LPNDRRELDLLSYKLGERPTELERTIGPDGTGELLRAGETDRLADGDRLGAERIALLENPLLRERLLAVRALERLPPPPKLPPLDRPPPPPLLRPLGPFAKIAPGSANSRKNARAAVSWANDVVNDESNDGRLKNTAFMSEIPGLMHNELPTKPSSILQLFTLIRFSQAKPHYSWSSCQSQRPDARTRLALAADGLRPTHALQRMEVSSRRPYNRILAFILK
jgi:hypothetical protein